MDTRPLAALLLLQAATCFAYSPCDPDTQEVATICEISLNDLHPSQFNVGRKQVLDSIADRGVPKADPRQAVLGPNGFYLLDGHHQAYGLVESGVAAMPIAICAKWKKQAEFWNNMQT